MIAQPHLLLGGGSRCGKSTAAREVRRATDIHTLSGDAVRNTLRRVVAYGTFPELHCPRAEKIPDERAFIEHHTTNVGLEIEAKRQQARFVWPFLEGYLREIEHESGEPVLLESIDVWPDLIAASGLHHRAAFLIDTSLEQADRIIATRDTDPYDWMHQNGYSDDKIRAWSNFNIQRGRLLRDLAAEAGYLCVDLAEVTMTESQTAVSEYLLAA